MTTLAQTQPTIDDLLNILARDIALFLTDIRQLNCHEGDKPTEMGDRCQALRERLQQLCEQLKSQRKRSREAMDRLRSALDEYREDLVEGPSQTRMQAMQAALSQRYEAFVETLRSKRIDIAETMDTESNRDPKLYRALFHIFMAMSCVALYQFVLTKTSALIVLSSFVTFFGTVEVLRRFSTRINDFWVDRIFGLVSRPQERYRTNSATYYMLGVALITLIAPRASSAPP